MTIIQKFLQFLGSARRAESFQQRFSLSHFASRLSPRPSPDFLVRQSLAVVRTFAAQKIRRLRSLESFTIKMNERNQLVDLINSLMRRVRSSKSKYLLGAAPLLSGCEISAEELGQQFDWSERKISEEESQQYFEHIDECREIQVKIKNSQACDWTPFIERKDILVWRREHPSMKGMYEYKMYGNFDDVTAEEFLSVQLDMTEFRLTWDKSTAQCVVIDEDRDSAKNGIVYYWEVNWPRFFSNRDYCCYRENSVEERTGTMVVVSHSVEHPACPSKKKTWRVEDYHSVLAIRPHTTSDKPGIEFSLTGFENPGLQLPESIITWVAVRGMPEFMMNLRAACIKLREERSAGGRSSKFSPESYQPRMGQSSIYA